MAISDPIQVPVHALKASLSQYLRQAEQGQDIIVTSHHRPVARLIGLESDEPAAARQLGGDWSGCKPSLRPPVPLADEGAQLSDIVLDERR